LYRTLNPWEEELDKYSSGSGKESELYHADDDASPGDSYHARPDHLPGDPLSESYHHQDREEEKDDKSDKSDKSEDDIFAEEGAAGNYQADDKAVKEDRSSDNTGKELTLDQIKETLERPAPLVPQEDTQSQSLKDVESLLDDLSRKQNRRELINLDKR